MKGAWEGGAAGSGGGGGRRAGGGTTYFPEAQLLLGLVRREELPEGDDVPQLTPV